MDIARRLDRLEAAAIEQAIVRMAGAIAEHEPFSAEELLDEAAAIVARGLTPADIAAELGVDPAELLAVAESFRPVVGR